MLNRFGLASLLVLDAATCAGMGVLLLGAARPLAAATDIAAGLRTPTGTARAQVAA